MPKTIVITGASDGIGAAAARRLAGRGHHVVVLGRSPEKTAAVARDTGGDSFVADFTRLDEVRGLAAELKSRYPVIDVLANNAGGIFGDRTRTVDGYEKTLQVNHLAPFLLTNLLIDTLQTSRAAVLNTSSIGARLFGRLDLGDLNNDTRFSPRKAYGDSKLANVLFARGLHQRFHAQGLSAVAFHPGNVATNFAADTTSLMRWVYHTPISRLVLIGPEEGAAMLVWLAEGTPGRDWTSGAYYEDKKVAATNRQASDDALVQELWDRSAAMVGLDEG